MNEELAVTLVGWRFDETVGFGVARYAANLLKGLYERKIRNQTIICPKYFDSPLNASLPYIFGFGLKVLTHIPQNSLYHFTLDHAGFGVPLLKKLYGIKVITTVHDINFHIPGGNQFPLRRRELEIMLNHSDFLIAASSQTGNDIMRYYGVPENKVRIIPHGVDRRFERLERSKNDAFTIGYIGGFARYKNVKFLLHAYSIFEKKVSRASRLVLYGKGIEYKECRRFSEKLGIKSIEFKGFAEETELVHIYNSFDIFAFPSKMEGFGLPILEAQRCGLPVIVWKDARIPEEITRFCLKADDEEHMADQMIMLHERRFEYPEGHRAYLDGFTWERCSDETVAVYEELFEKG